MEETVEAYAVFCRKTLRKTVLCKSSKGKFAIVTKILDRDTLQVETIRSVFLPESMNNIVWLYMRFFQEETDIAPINGGQP